MDCQEFEELSGAYALGALTPDEQQRADEHLAQCLKCQETYQELKSVVDLLPLTVPTVKPSPLVGERILASIRASEAHRTYAPQERQQPQVRSRESYRGIRFLALAAVLIIGLLGGLLAWNISLQQQLASVSMPLQPPIVYNMKSTNGTLGADGEVIYFPQQHMMALVIHGLPKLADTHVYQGWLLQNNHPKSIGLFTVQNGIATLNFSGDVHGYDMAAVSVEQGPKGSEKAPQGPVVAAGSLKSPLQAENAMNYKWWTDSFSVIKLI